MSKHKDLVGLVHETLKRHRAARRQGAKAFGRMAKDATAAVLREELQSACEAAEGEADRIDAVFAVLGKKPHDETCDVTEAHLATLKTLAGELKGGAALDDGLAAVAAALQGLAAGRLALLRAWAGRLDEADAVALLGGLEAVAAQSRDRLAARVGPRQEPSPPDSGAALTPKQAALIGLR